MKKEILKKQKRLTKEGYVVVPNYFLREWVKVLGVGPALLYLQLLSYCHKEKDIAWPTLTTLPGLVRAQHWTSSNPKGQPSGVKAIVSCKMSPRDLSLVVLIGPSPSVAGWEV